MSAGFSILVGSAILFAAVMPAPAQSVSVFDGTTPTGLAPGSPVGSYGLSGFEHYNPFSGMNNLSFPLYHVGGRGEAGFDLAWTIPQQWTVTTALAAPNLPSFQPPVQTWAPAKQLLGAGNVVIKEGVTWGCGNPSYPTNTLSRIMFTEADGTQVEFIDALGGSINTVYAPCAPAQTQPGPNSNRNTTFYSTNAGVQLVFEADSAVIDSLTPSSTYTSPVSGYLYFPNGVVYRIDSSLVTSITDRNGNKVSLTYSAGQLTQVIDALGRQILINYQDASCSGCTTITYPGTSGNSRVIHVFSTSLAAMLRSDFSLRTYNQLFPDDTTDQGQYNPAVVSSIEYPDGNSFTFRYNGYAEVARVSLPTGAAVEYDHGDWLNGQVSGFQANSDKSLAIVYRRIQERREYPTGGAGSAYSSRTHYTESYPYGNTVDTDATYDSAGVQVAQVIHTMNGSPLDSVYMRGTSCNPGPEGLEIQTAYGAPGPWKTVSHIYPAQPACTNNPLLQEESTLLDDGILTSGVTFWYDQFYNVIGRREYDWGPGYPGGALMRETRTTYLGGTDQTGQDSYRSARFGYGAYLVSIPSSQTVFDASGNEVAQTVWHYDETPVQANSGMVGHDDAHFPSTFTTRGNATTEFQWLKASNTFITTSRTFDVAGNPLTVKDPNGNTTVFNYADPQNTFANVTRTTNALNQAVTSTYDYSTGKPLSTTDVNNGTTTYSYIDSLDRLTEVVSPNGSTASYSYPSPNETDTYQDQTSGGDRALRTQVLYDGFGRAAESRTYENSTSYIFTTQSYDALGRVVAVTNPSRPGDNLNYSTTYSYDSLGRPTRVATADGAVACVSYSGNQVTATDQTGLVRISTSDALGRLTQVVEDPSANWACNGVGSPSPHLNYNTTYSYDALNDLTGVNQSGQTRSFGYDSLTNLVSASNPESGVSSYSYDNNGNVSTRTDNRGIVTNYQYDALNRILRKSYSDGTPTVSYGYDAAGVPNSTGHLTSAATASSITSFTGFDAMGNVLSSNHARL